MNKYLYRFLLILFSPIAFLYVIFVEKRTAENFISGMVVLWNLKERWEKPKEIDGYKLGKIIKSNRKKGQIEPVLKDAFNSLQRAKAK